MAHILVIEDSPAMSKLIELKLKGEGHTVRVYEDGQRGLASVVAEPPELLVLDVDLPYMDGFEVARLIRQHDHVSNLPILMLTGRSDVDSRLRGLEHADDYLSKPFNSQELNARIKALLRRSSFVRIIKARRVDELGGETIGQYERLEPIGRGGMSIVYKAHDSILNRFVALKFFTDLANNSDLKERFMREAKAAARLNHANICNVYTIDETVDGHPFMVMPFLEGQTLEQLIAKKPLNLAKAINYAKQIARGLASAHSLGIVHRDIKPANIFITTQGTVKVLDFGVARWQRFEGTQLTRPGSMVGTIQYMPPEQILSLEVDSRADIWALGAVMFEMLTGINPFGPGINLLASINTIINEGAPNLEDYYDSPPKMLLKVFSKTLAKKPQDRYNTVMELLLDLDEVDVPGEEDKNTFSLRY